MSLRLVFPAKYFSDINSNNTQMNIVAVYVSFDQSGGLRTYMQMDNWISYHMGQDYVDTQVV